MKTCVKCVLPENFPGVQLDADGKCSYCKFHEQHAEELNDFPRLEQRFQRIVEEAKATARTNGSRWDCLVGFSGGKDSTYVIHRLKHEYGMRVLAFTFDNGFLTDYGDRNTAIALDRLDVEHVVLSPSTEFLRDNYALTVKMMRNFCVVCFHYVHYFSFLTAAEKRIPLVVNGRSRGQVMQIANSREMLEPFEQPMSLREFEFLMRKTMNPQLLAQMEQAKLIDYLDDVRIRTASYFMYHPYSEESVIRFLEQNIPGWERPKKVGGHPDCWAHPVAERFHVEAKQYPIATGELAVKVREGAMTREAALAALAEDRVDYATVAPDLMARFNDRITPRARKA